MKSIHMMKRFVRCLLWAIRLRSARWAVLLTRYDIPLETAHLNPDGALVFCSDGAIIPRSIDASHVLGQYHKLRDILAAGGVLEMDGRRLEVEGVHFNIETSQTIQIIHEVFIERVYGLNVRGPSVLIDVGMNVGIASLFFSKMGILVYGFEPFARTFQSAQQNLAMNPTLAERVIIANVGLGKRDCSASARYDPSAPGNCRVVSTTVQTVGRGECAEMESVDLRSAGAEVRKIVCEYPEARIILKIDCEGAEVEILESLEESGSIESVSIMMIEWHRWASMDLPDSMEEFLRDRGFAVVGRGWKMRDVGMIYAVRLGNPRSTCADDSRTAKVEDS